MTITTSSPTQVIEKFADVEECKGSAIMEGEVDEFLAGLMVGAIIGLIIGMGVMELIYRS